MDANTRIFRESLRRKKVKSFKKFAAVLLILCMVMPMPQKAVNAAINDKSMPLISGSFIQGWICRDWTQERWNDELAMMKELGMETLIIQSSYDIASDAGTAVYGQDWSKYRITSRYSLYPTDIPELAGYYNSSDQLEKALISARENGMTIFIGLISDDRWWRFGWGQPLAENAGADLASESYMAQWCRYNGELSAKMIDEIWERYGHDYGEQIAGFYYNNEIWNFDAACNGEYRETYAKIIADSFNHYIKAINDNCADKQFMFSPFFNRTISTAIGYRDFWKSVFQKTDFRKGDIFAPQDCIGEHEDEIDSLREWIGGMHEAAKSKEGLYFYVNNETFTPAYTPAQVNRVIRQIETTEEFAQSHLLFSWNHYYNPLVNSSYKAYHDELKSYIESVNESRNKEQSKVKIQIDGFQVSTTYEGFRTIYSVSDIENEVESIGLIYGLGGYVNETDMTVDSRNDYVHIYEATPLGKSNFFVSNLPDSDSYIMTMKFAAKTAEYYGAVNWVRAYARLKNGECVYSDICRTSVYDLADYLYKNVMSPHYADHQYLYEEILKVVHADYAEVDYDWRKSLVQPN